MTRPFVLGITGSMAMGKSTVARMAANGLRGAVRLDSDRVVHELLGPKGAAVAVVGETFPESLRYDAQGRAFIDRKALGTAVFGHPEKLSMLEALLHHRVRASNVKSIRQARLQGRRFVVIEIPLLFETEAEMLCDAVWVASAPAFLQRQRALKRPGMNEAKLHAALARQWPDRDKRARADAVIPTGLGKAYSMRTILSLLAQ